MTRGGRPLVVATPDVEHYGSLGIEILMALAVARRAGAAVYFVRPPTVTHDGLFELESPEVPVLEPSAATATLLRARLQVSGIQKDFASWRAGLAKECRRELHRELGPLINTGWTPASARNDLRTFRHRLRAYGDDVERLGDETSPYLQRKLLRTPLPVRLRPEAEAEAARQAVSHGIDPAAPLVCIHARESNVAQARRSLATYRDKATDGADDRVRNARIDSYLEACAFLTARGFTIVRLGGATATPLGGMWGPPFRLRPASADPPKREARRRAGGPRPGIVDLAASPARTSLLEVYCLLRSRLVITGESSLASVAYLTNTPRLIVNVSEPFAAYPIRAPGLMLTKAVIDRRTGGRLAHADQLGEEYHRRFRDPRRYQYLDNTPEEILEATREMLDWLDGRWTESAAQRGYHEAIGTAAAALRAESTYLRTLGPDGGFLGDGRIAKVAMP
jgi:putative glycosyltransferase (TIGR04372 family)